MIRPAARLTGFAIGLTLAAGLGASAEPRATLGASGALDRPPADGSSSGGPLRITGVRLNPGGFLPCPDSNLPLGMLNGRRNPDADQIKCVTAEVTIQGSRGDDYPTLHAALEGWGFAVLAGGERYDYRSPAQLYPEHYDVGAVGPPGAGRWSWNALAVTYYDGKLEWAGQPEPTGSLIASAPEPIRDHLRSPGAWVEFSIVGSSAPVVRCRYLGPSPPAPDRLICDGLPREQLTAPTPFGPGPNGRPR
jgi:hypothetical protein